MKRITALFLLIGIMFASCSSSKDKELAKINELEKTVLAKTTTPVNLDKAKELVDAYIKYAKDYPKDTCSVNYLFKAANMSMNIGKGQLAVDLFDQIIKDYPEYSKVSDCMFLKAFVYDNTLKEYKKAKIAYEAFINKYPTHEFADDAQACLDNLGKTPEQLIKEFETKQKEDSLASSKK
jgi:outer membrane protein assembly factor BamD (BamD/ComL family)